MTTSIHLQPLVHMIKLNVTLIFSSARTITFYPSSPLSSLLQLPRLWSGIYQTMPAQTTTGGVHTHTENIPLRNFFLNLYKDSFVNILSNLARNCLV